MQSDDTLTSGLSFQNIIYTRMEMILQAQTSYANQLANLTRMIGEFVTKFEVANSRTLNFESMVGPEISKIGENVDNLISNVDKHDTQAKLILDNVMESKKFLLDKDGLVKILNDIAQKIELETKKNVDEINTILGYMKKDSQTTTDDATSIIDNKINLLKEYVNEKINNAITKITLAFVGATSLFSLIVYLIQFFTKK